MVLFRKIQILIPIRLAVIVMMSMIIDIPIYQSVSI